MMNRQAPMQAVDQLGTTLSGIISDRGRNSFAQQATKYFMDAEAVTPDAIKQFMSYYPNVDPQEVLKIAGGVASQKKAQRIKDLGSTIMKIAAENGGTLPEDKFADIFKNANGEDLQEVMTVMREFKRAHPEVKWEKLSQGETAHQTIGGKPTGQTLKGEAKAEVNNVEMTSPDRKTKVKVKESEVKAYEDKGYMRGEPTALDSKSEEPYKAGHVQQFDVGDRIVYKKYLGNGEWEDIKGVGGPRYKPTSGAPAEDKAAKKETNATIRALEKDLANRDAYLRRMQKIVDDPMKSGAEKKIAQQNIETTYERKEKVQTLINDVRDGVVNKVKWGGNSEQQPQQDLTQLVTEARQAIAKGAPKDKVLQRLRGMGYKGNL
jgi:hypothetical protein